MFRKQLACLIAKHRGTTWFEHDHRSSHLDFGLEFADHPLYVAFCPREHTEIVQRAAATKARCRDHRLETCVFQHSDCGTTDLRMEVIDKSVRPKNYPSAAAHLSR